MQDLRSENWLEIKRISGLLQETVIRDQKLRRLYWSWIILDLDYSGFGIYWIQKRDKVWIVEKGIEIY